ncbi:MAG TPA: ribosome maturation factor RimP [Mycobacteriales bacterium]|nr:ribosome maturation factor RimP [Mycobacteriales bacterium]
MTDEQLHTEGGLAVPDPGASRARLVQLLTPAVAASGYDLEDLSVSPAGRRKVVRVVVDVQEGAVGSLSLDDIAAVSRAVSDLLDTPEAEKLLEGAYTLEVTSPGVDRPLTAPRHWRRSVGRLVAATTADGTVTGRVLEADEAQAVLDVDGARRALLYGEVVSALVQVEFSRPGEQP